MPGTAAGLKKKNLCPEQNNHTEEVMNFKSERAGLPQNVLLQGGKTVLQCSCI